MPVVKRNMLCLKNKENLDLGQVILYEPYKNILLKFYELATDPKAVEFDPISRIFDGLESVSDEFKYYYEALLAVSSYYQHSKGGKGKLIEKRLSSLVETCTVNIKMSEIPLWLENPALHRKKGIFTLNGLTRDEKRIIRLSEWSYIGNEDSTTDVGNLIAPESTIVLMELKNRVDSGGTAARREIWQKKFVTLLKLFQKAKLYKRSEEEISFKELISKFGYRSVEIYLGILFSVDGTPATLKADKETGFYISNKEGLRDLLQYVQNTTIEIIHIDWDRVEVILDWNGMRIKIGALYGNEIPLKLFRKKYSITDLLVLKYDDIWLGQLMSIWERSVLLKKKTNFSVSIKAILLRDEIARILYDEFIESEGEEESLRDLVDYLLDNYPTLFSDIFCPEQRELKEYLGDVIQFVGAVEA